MNIEELKLVLETVSAVSGDAKSVAIWWLVASYGMTLAGQLAIAITVYLVARLVVRVISDSMDWASFGRDCAKAWGGEGDTFSYRRDRKIIAAIIKAAPEKTK